MRAKGLDNIFVAMYFPIIRVWCTNDLEPIWLHDSFYFSTTTLVRVPVHCKGDTNIKGTSLLLKMNSSVASLFLKKRQEYYHSIRWKSKKYIIVLPLNKTEKQELHHSCFFQRWFMAISLTMCA